MYYEEILLIQFYLEFDVGNTFGQRDDISRLTGTTSMPGGDQFEKAR